MPCYAACTNKMEKLGKNAPLWASYINSLRSAFCFFFNRVKWYFKMVL